jgi:hypothetical protein
MSRWSPEGIRRPTTLPGFSVVHRPRARVTAAIKYAKLQTSAPDNLQTDPFGPFLCIIMYSVNVMVGDDEETLVEGGRPMNGYRRD